MLNAVKDLAHKKHSKAQNVTFNINAAEGVEKREPSYTVGGNVN